jgi:hypothetical protein
MVVSTIIDRVSLEHIIDIVSRWELGGIGWLRCSTPGQSSLETDGIDLWCANTMHGDNLVSNQVVSGHQ